MSAGKTRLPVSMSTSDYPILDNHIHLDPKGLSLEGAKKFQNAGGTHLILVHKPYYHINRNDFRLQFDITQEIAENVRKKTGLTVFTALCPHPAQLTGLMKDHSLEEAKEIMQDAIDLAANYIREGNALCFGEAGRPHYPVEEEILETANQLITYTLELAKDLNCVVQFHTEGGEGSFRDIASIARKVGFPVERCVKHFSGPSVLQEENYGLFPSVVSRSKSIAAAISKGNRFFMETDYIDELSRPNVVLPPDTVPKITMKLLKKGILSEEDIHVIHKENPEKVYGIEMDV